MMVLNGWRVWGVNPVWEVAARMLEPQYIAADEGQPEQEHERLREVASGIVDVVRRLAEQEPNELL